VCSVSSDVRNVSSDVWSVMYDVFIVTTDVRNVVFFERFFCVKMGIFWGFLLFLGV